MTESSLPAANLDDAREHVVERLSIHYARDQLTLDELESRLERVYAARTAQALDAVLAGLPALSPASASITAARAPKAPRSRNYFAVMSGVIRRGAWLVPKRISAVAFMGGFEDQLKQPASGDPNAPAVRLTGFAFMGGVEARVLEPGAPAD